MLTKRWSIEPSGWYVLAMQQRIDMHVDERVDRRRHHHYALDYFRDNIPALAAGKCLTDQIVENVRSYRMDECLFKIPNEDASNGPFKLISNGTAETILGKLEGSYLVFEQLKKKWVRSGMTAGEPVATCFSGRIKKTCTKCQVGAGDEKTSILSGASSKRSAEHWGQHG